MILKTKYIDHTTMTSYNVGDNVSHLEDEQIKFLTEGGHVKTEGAGNSDAQQIKAAELIEKINAAETAEEVDALVSEGETRTTVLKAAEARKAKLEVIE